MEINTNTTSSEAAYKERLTHLDLAGAGLIHVRTDEIWRTVLATRNIAMGGLASSYVEWDCLAGTKKLDPTSMYNLAIEGDRQGMASILEEIVSECAQGTETNTKYVALINPQYFWAAPMDQQSLQLLSTILPTSNIRLLMITPDIPAPEYLGDGLATIHMDSPSFNELMECAKELLEGIHPTREIRYTTEEMRDICYAGMGMGLAAFEMHLALGLTEKGLDAPKAEAGTLIASVNRGKTDILHKSDLLELYPQDDMSNVGGMENIKEWVAKRSGCYTEAAVAHGITPPKGCVVVGVPGSGKSLLAKCVAGQLGVSLVRLDFGRVFNSLVGASEERMRTALKHVESMAPCVLFVDEADKGLGGIGSSGGDSGTSSRVLGCFLSWLNDNTKPVFTIMTANNVDGLPPELLRKGRFDEIFATGLPDVANRKEILSIHLRKRGWLDDFNQQELQLIAESLKGFVGAEIEAVVKDALIDSFHKGENLEIGHLQEAIDNTTPLSKSHAKSILEMTAWAKACATPAGKKDFVDETNVTKLGGRARRKPRVTTDKE